MGRFMFYKYRLRRRSSDFLGKNNIPGTGWTAAKDHGSRGSVPSILPWNVVICDHDGHRSRVRPFHCTWVRLSPHFRDVTPSKSYVINIRFQQVVSIFVTKSM